MEAILQAKEISKTYHTGSVDVPALKQCSLEFGKGEFTAIIGKSGSGKSTLLRILGSMDTPDTGSILIKGEDITHMKDKKLSGFRRRNIGFIYQDYSLFPEFTSYENIVMPILLDGKKPDDAKVDEILSELEISHCKNKYPSEMSGGEQQRVAIARALITKPAIVLLDEPLCNLDIQLRIEMRTEMAQLFHSLKTTVFHVTHDPSEAFAMADRIIVMNNGMIDQMDTPFACYLQPGTSMVAGLLGAGNCLMKALITSGSDEFCQVSLGGKKLTGLYFKPTGKAGTEDGTQVPFRAELRFRPEECGWQETEGENTIPVTVVMSTFEGGVYRIKVMTAEGEGFCLLHQDFLEEGKTGYACIAKERLYMYEKN